MAENGVYRKLQQTMDRMPLGYPSTKTGEEIDLLKAVFSPEQAAVAMHLDYRHRSVDEIYNEAPDSAPSKEELKRLLDESVSRGAIFRRYRGGQAQYALMPFVLWGIYEHQLRRMNRDFLEKTGRYLGGEMGFEMATHPVPKMRVIPIEESVEPEHYVATYDELRRLIEQAGDHITIQDCVCRKGMDLLGKPCTVTDRREVCMSLGDLAELYAEEGWGRKISKEEALEIARKNEEEGLVLMPSNGREPKFLCACCSDCCGMIGMMKAFPKPAEVVGSNFLAAVDERQCSGCGICIERCPLEAVELNDGISVINLKRCVGCGLCVPTCNDGALHLVRKQTEVMPPANEEEMIARVRAYKNSLKGKVQGTLVKTMLRTLTRFANKPAEQA